MARKFEPIKIGWKNRTYTIPANKVMGAIARIEEHVTLVELQRYHKRGGTPLAKLANAFADVLDYAGASGVTPDEIYLSMFGDSDEQARAGEAVVAILGMMTPPGEMQRGNSKAPIARVSKTVKGAASSSKRPGSRSSEPAS